MEAYAGKQFVGIDLHRRRSVIVRTTEAGEVLEAVRIVNDVQRLASVMARAGHCPEVVLEATYGWVLGSMRLQASPVSATPKTAGSLLQGWTPNERGAASAPQLATPGPKVRHPRQVQARLGLTAVPTPRWPRDRCHQCARGRSYVF